jgi:hypothetical protein
MRMYNSDDMLTVNIRIMCSHARLCQLMIDLDQAYEIPDRFSVYFKILLLNSICGMLAAIKFRIF